MKTTKIKIGDKVSGGEPGTSDYDVGIVDEIATGFATVRWESGITTTQAISALRLVKSK